jgi:hypothetical protein
MGTGVSPCRRAADVRHAAAQRQLGGMTCGGAGGEDPNCALGAEWHRKAADQGDAWAQYHVGKLYALGKGYSDDWENYSNVKKDLPFGKRYLELAAAQAWEGSKGGAKVAAVTLLKELRKCVCCGELDVRHMICSRCRRVRQGLTLVHLSAQPEPFLTPPNTP